jgi:hypothetical protein
VAAAGEELLLRMSSGGGPTPGAIIIENADGNVFLKFTGLAKKPLRTNQRKFEGLLGSFHKE